MTYTNQPQRATTDHRTMETKQKKDPFAGYVPHGPEWKAYMMKQTKALCIEVATGIADERDRLKVVNKELHEVLSEILAITDRKHDAWDRAKAIMKRSGHE